MKGTRRSFASLLSIGSFTVALAACGGGGGSGDGTGTDDPGVVTQPAPLTHAATDVPLVGELVADCADTGIAIADSVIDTVTEGSGFALPTGTLPNLRDVISLVDLGTVPVIGGLVPGVDGDLESISLQAVLALIPGGANFDDLPVLGQLPLVCQSLIDALPEGALSDPAALLAALGDPSAALGFIPVFDGAGDPIGLLLATLPSGLGGVSGGLPGLPGVTNLPDVGSLAPLDPSNVSDLGGAVEMLLGLLNTGGLPIPGLSGLLALLNLNLI